MFRLKISALAGLIFIGGGGFLFSQDSDPRNTKPPLELADYNWEKDAQKNFKLSDAEIDTLRKQGLVVTKTEFRQIFSPYLWGTQVFITSDTVINAYAILLEDSVLRLERTNDRRLGAFLDCTWKQLAGDMEHCPANRPLAKAGFARAQLIIGVALELYSGEKVKAPSPIASQINAEAKRVIAATGQGKPDWLGPPDPGFLAIDYTRFKPRGFYNGDPKLERYFRAVSWLQAIPFRFDNDGELMAFMALYEIAHNSRDNDIRVPMQEMAMVSLAYEELLGMPDNGDLFGRNSSSFSAPLGDPAYLPEVRSRLDMDEPKDGSQINDQIALPGKDGKPERSFRILAAHRVPDAVLFAHLDDIRKAEFPSGLDVAAALGSPTARALYASKNAELLKKIDAEKKLFQDDSLYGQFLDALSVLLQPIDKAAPDLFRGPAWQTKSLQTVLGGWAQARHVWVLQTKENVEWLGDSESVPSGFVEPVPDFFSKMGHLAGETREILSESGVLEGEDTGEAVVQIRAVSAVLKQYAEQLRHDPKVRLSEDDDTTLASAGQWMVYINPDDPDPSGAKNLAVDAAKLDALATRLETTGVGSDTNLKGILSRMNPSPESNWDHLATLCAKLEALSQKQLRGVPLSPEDNGYISDYGQTLAGIMFYAGNSYEQPRDDAPRICDIFVNPGNRKALHVGIGRPRELFVLYPYGGKQILTHGAVFPYYEFAQADRLTDQEWLKLLSSPSAPEQPDWLGPLSGK